MSERQRLSAEERTNLVAYLDGELDEEASRPINAKLVNSASARHEVEGLKRVWDLLDYLPRPKASAELTARTLSLATQLDAQGGRLVEAAGGWARSLAMTAAALLAVAGAAGLGYVGTRWVWPDPTARLARDLSIAERLDAYLDAGSLQFLRLLDQSPHAFPADEP